jgi:hypothetical protein
MNGVHDMGGMHGFGPVPQEEDEPVFTLRGKAGCLASFCPWAPRASMIPTASATPWNTWNPTGI